MDIEESRTAVSGLSDQPQNRTAAHENPRLKMHGQDEKVSFL